MPGDVLRQEEANLQTLLAGLICGSSHLSPVEKVDLVDVSDADDREGSIDVDVGTGFLDGFPSRGVSCAFAIFHKARW